MKAIKKIGLIGTLASTIIGAGVFSLPYIFSRVGALNGVVFLFCAFFMYVCIHSMYAYLLLKNQNLEFGGVSKKYFGFWGNITQWIILLELICVCAAYLILAPEFFSFLGVKNVLVAVCIFLSVGFLGLMIKTKAIEWFEVLGLFGIIAIIGTIGWFGFARGGGINWVGGGLKSLDSLLLFGPLFFAFSGRPIIARIVQQIKKGEEKSLVEVMFWGTAIPAVLYAVYTFGVLQLGSYIKNNIFSSFLALPHSLLIPLSILGLVAILTSYVAILINIKDMFVSDVKIKKGYAVFIAVVIPFILFLVSSKNFISVVGFVGGVFLALEGMFIVRMWQKENKSRFINILLWIFFAPFILAMIYEVRQFLW